MKVVLGLVLGLSVLAAAAGLAQDSQSAPVWQVYQNAKYGYEIGYPDGFVLYPTGPAGQRDGASFRITFNDFAAPIPVLDVTLRREPIDLAQLAEPPERGKKVSYERASINGMPARLATYRWPENGEVALFEADCARVRFVFAASAGIKDVRETVWWRIINTFCFQDAAGAGLAVSGAFGL